MHPALRLHRLLELLRRMFPRALCEPKLRWRKHRPSDVEQVGMVVRVRDLRELLDLLDEPGAPAETAPLPARPTDPPAPAWPDSTLPAADLHLARTDAPDEGETD